MSEPDKIAVRAASKAFRVLTHQPSGEGFDEKGNGLWPADQFTFRLIEEGALKRRTDEEIKADAADADAGNAPVPDEPGESAAAQQRRRRGPGTDPAPAILQTDTSAAPTSGE